MMIVGFLKLKCRVGVGDFVIGVVGGCSSSRWSVHLGGGGFLVSLRWRMRGGILGGGN